jgi:hypothetical protein
MSIGWFGSQLTSSYDEAGGWKARIALKNSA